MDEIPIQKRFGAIAIDKGFITKEQFVEAMAMQIENELEGKIIPIGWILESMGYMTEQQIDEVLATLIKAISQELT